MLPSISENFILLDYQFDFCTAHSTTQQIHSIFEVLSTYRKKKLYCIMVYFLILPVPLTEFGMKASNTN